MKSFIERRLVPSVTPGRDDVLISEQFLTVDYQYNSPVVNGVLHFRSNPLSYMRAKQTVARGFYSWYWDPTTRYEIVPYIQPLNRDYLTPLFKDLITEVENKFILKVQSFGTNMIDIYRTRKETIDMVTTAVRKLTYVYQSVKRKKWRNVCNLLGISYKKPTKKNHNNPPGAWLEYTYGWSPLVDDVYTLLDKTFPEIKLSVFNAGSDFQTIDFSDGSYTFGEYFIGCKVKSKGEIFVSDSTLRAISYYGIDNPSLALWEALPYSFVVDWFTGIGDYLQALTAFNGLELRNYSCSVSFNYTANKVIIPRSSMINSSPGSSVLSGNTYYRQVGSPTYRFPSISNGLTLSRFASALSLMAQAFSKR